MLRILFIVLLVVVLSLGVAVGYFNSTPVRFNYLAGEMQLPLIALVLGEFILVALLTLGLCGIKMLKLMNEARRLKRQIKDQQAELTALRNLPLREAGSK